MDIKLQATLIAGSVSITIAIISAIFSYKREKESRKRFELEQRRDLASKLYDRRLDIYPQAFLLTEKIDRSKGYSNEGIVELQIEAKENLREWHGNGAALIMSARSVKLYYRLLNYLGKQPGDNGEFSDKQRENLLTYRSEFRSSLREDVGILHDSADTDT